MTTTNITQVKHLDGRKVIEQDIVPGMQIYAPSQTGGVLKYECVARTDAAAEFKSVNPDWPLSFEMKFNQPDFDLERLEALYLSLIVFQRQNHLASADHRRIIREAHELGYVHQSCHTQASWTEKGCDLFRKAKESAPDIVVNGYKIRYNPLWNAWQSSHDDVGACEEFQTQTEAVQYANKG